LYAIKLVEMSGNIEFLIERERKFSEACNHINLLKCIESGRYIETLKDNSKKEYVYFL
jgi:hypothetical protein